MNRDDIKTQLYSYRCLEVEKQQIELELQRIASIMRSPRTANLDGMPRSPGTGDPVARMVLQYAELENRYLVLRGRLAAEQAHVEEMIESLDPRARRLLRLRYIDGLTWEDVGEAMGYSERQANRIHDDALEKLLERENAQEKERIKT